MMKWAQNSIKTSDPFFREKNDANNFFSFDICLTIEFLFLPIESKVMVNQRINREKKSRKSRHS